MANPMDNVPYNIVTNDVSVLQNTYKNAMANPKAFEEYVKRTNPSAYQNAVRLARSNNPKDIVMQILSSKGINPAMFNM